MREPLDTALQHALDVREDAGVHVHRHQSAFAVVDGEPGGPLELLQTEAKPPRRPRVGTQDNQRIVGVLEDGARHAVHERVLQLGVGADQALENIGDEEEEVG